MTHCIYSPIILFWIVPTFIALGGDLFSNPVATDIPISQDARDTIQHCIDDYYNDLSDAQLLQFTDDNKKEWLKYMPSVGLTYTPSGQPRPGISIGSALIYNSYKDKRAKEETIRSIKLTNQLTADSEVLNFNMLIQQLELMKQDLEHEKRTLQIDTELFEFYTKQHESNQMTPSQYLLKKKDYYNKLESLRKSESAIQLHRLQIIQASRCQ